MSRLSGPATSSPAGRATRHQPSSAPHAPYTCTAEIFRARRAGRGIDVPLMTHLPKLLGRWRTLATQACRSLPRVTDKVSSRCTRSPPTASTRMRADCMLKCRRRRRPQPDLQSETRRRHRAVCPHAAPGVKVGIARTVQRRTTTWTCSGCTPGGFALQRRQRQPDGGSGAGAADHGDAGRRPGIHLGDVIGTSTRQAGGHDRSERGALHNVSALQLRSRRTLLRRSFTQRMPHVIDAPCNAVAGANRVLLTLDAPRWPRVRRKQTPRGSTCSSDRARGSVLDKIVAIGGAVEEESFEVQVKARITTDAEPIRGADRGRRVSCQPRPAGARQYDTLFAVRRRSARPDPLPRRPPPRPIRRAHKPAGGTHDHH